MKFTGVEIVNFRSIEELDINFSSGSAVGLVGINESGKSNVLRALLLLSSEASPQASDVRMNRLNDETIEDSHVQFSFELDDDEIDSLIEEMTKKVIGNKVLLPALSGKKGLKSFHDFARSRREVLHYVDVMNEDVSYYTISLDDEFQEVMGDWFRIKSTPSPENPMPVTIEGESQVINVKKGNLICAPGLAGILPESIAVKLDMNSLDRIWQEIVGEYAEKHLPEVIFWNYEKENLLPASIDIDAFCSAPEKCKPLQSMFEIFGVFDIKETIEQAKKGGRNRLDNLLRRVSNSAAEHVREVWKDYKAATIDLIPDGNEIRVSVRDTSLGLSFADRSDGFKRFMTFLLLVSAKVKTNALQNVLFLIDEPEISLHPAGIRNLRDELLRISENNYVVFATHSPHMIDRRNIERHLLIEKVDEVTRGTRAGNGRVFDEEVLLNSLGASVFEALKPSTLIFEGWRDKKLFEVFRDSNRKTAPFKELANVGLTYVNGVKDAKNVVPILALACTRINVISDHDDAAIEHRKSFLEARFNSGWFTYRELEAPDSEAVTAEDFIKPVALKKAFDALRKKHAFQIAISEEELQGSNRLYVIKLKLRSLGLTKEQLRSYENEFKSLVFDSLKFSSIDDRYSVVVTSIAKECAI